MSHYNPDPSKNVNLTIDGVPVTVPEGTRILEAAKKVNIKIPTLCDHPDLCRRALCRVCVVEYDGRSKLLAACANDVWEGVNIVTNNLRILNTRKTIVELILVNHPHECTFCVRSKKCELQSLAKSFSLFEPSFENDSPEIFTSIEKATFIENKIIVRNMRKCIKCMRCVEVCQEVQTIRAINTSHRSFEYRISSPYNQPVEDGLCVYCGKCSEVCPVGAIYGYDQVTKILLSLYSKMNNVGEERVIAQISPELAEKLNKEFVFSDKTITAGKMITAIKMLGFDKVFDSAIAANISNSQMCGELEQRIRDGGRLPLISGNSLGITRFVKNFYPSLIDHLPKSETPRQVFAETVKTCYAAKEGIDPQKITSVSFVPDIARKYGVNDKTDYALTAIELVRMLKISGIRINELSESDFDTIELPNQTNAACLEQKEITRGYAKARKVMEAIQKGECTAKWVEIESSPN